MTRSFAKSIGKAAPASDKPLGSELPRKRSDSEEVHCQCGRVTGDLCSWSGPLRETVVIEWVPGQARASGFADWRRAERIRVRWACADVLCRPGAQARVADSAS